MRARSTPNKKRLMTIIILILILLLAAALFIFSKKFFSANEVKHNAINDPAAQAAYYNNKHKNDQPKLTLKEKIELSWKFLYEITEIILNKFSSQDRKAVEDAGRTLANKGMKYEHVVELGIRHKPTQTISVEVESEQGKTQSAGRSL